MTARGVKNLLGRVNMIHMPFLTGLQATIILDPVGLGLL